MSGGQMQRVAIARALVNNPDILLADEPTGALDTETSVQVMELLKEVAKDRLVVMVTHNPELAEEYATRIVKLRDGKILDDSDPYLVDDAKLAEPEHKNMGHASMSLGTALSLSFNNLRTKKARTLLTAFAGSIGIIGIALILSLSTGVNRYITDLQKSTMTSYPVTIEAQTMDLSSVLASGKENRENMFKEADHALDAIYSDPSSIEMASSVTMSITTNNLSAFKKYLDDKESKIYDYVGENGIVYSYNTKFSVFTYDPDGTFVNTDGSTLTGTGSASTMGMMSMMSGSSYSSNQNFEQLLPGQEGAPVSDALYDSYEVLYGSWPSAYDEVVLVVDRNNEISAATLYQLGILPAEEYKEVMKKIEAGEQVSLETVTWSYEDICDQKLYLIPACDMFAENEDGLFEDISADEEAVKKLAEDAVTLKIVGVIRAVEDADYANLMSPIAYTKGLTDYLIDYSNHSAVVKAQEEDPEHNVLNGAEFSPADDEAKVADTKTYISHMTVEEKASMCREILQQVYGDDPENAQMMLNMTDTELAGMLDQYVSESQEAADERLLSIYDAYISAGSYDENMESFGYVSMDAPSSISIYTDTFENKDAITDCIAEYNQTAEEEDQITYTDYVGLLMSSVTTIVDVISYVLIAFVAVSLVVSSIMIGIITYISVLERTKEIGILRAIGASKRNISQVFNAETFIIGLCSGVIGIGITLLLLIPGNAIIHKLTDSVDVNAQLPAGNALLLILLSVLLTCIGGLIPSKKAAKKDPVTALRTE